MDASCGLYVLRCGGLILDVNVGMMSRRRDLVRLVSASRVWGRCFRCLIGERLAGGRGVFGRLRRDPLLLGDNDLVC